MVIYDYYFLTTLLLLISYSLDYYDPIAPSKKSNPPTIKTTTDEKSTVIVCYKTQKLLNLDFFSPLFYFMLLSLHDKKLLGIVTNFLRRTLQKASFDGDIDLLAEIVFLTVLKSITGLEELNLKFCSVFSLVAR